MTNVTNCFSHRSPPRPPIERLALDDLWNLLSDEQRHRTLATLSGILVRQLDVPREEKEVPDERF
ncbi:MAG: hypothetical protein ACRD19_08660 [Terriglobia bacterium]